jgi:hypothetical protein
VPDALIPDIVLILGEHLRGSALVTARVGARSGERLSQTLPAIRYAVTATPWRGPEEWEPTAQIECWAPDDGDEVAWDTARAVVASIADLPGQRSTGMVAAAEATNVFSSPDPETHRPRVIVLVNLLVFGTDPEESL